MPTDADIIAAPTDPSPVSTDASSHRAGEGKPGSTAAWPRKVTLLIGVVAALAVAILLSQALFRCFTRAQCATVKHADSAKNAASRPLPSLPALPGREPAAVAAELGSLPVDAALVANRAAPFVKGPVAPSRGFAVKWGDADHARAVDCLAAAQLYEAGMDEDGQKAVAQVILNRVRHPAFPPTICGVVFEGSERATGCQFTFTCDGALVRRYSDAAWEKARRMAGLFLKGQTDPRVGWATHYHTDWVYPYWSPSLDKVSAIGTHMFFRWRGFWGTPSAFRERYAGNEPVVRKLLAALPSIPPEAAILPADLAAVEDQDAIVAPNPTSLPLPSLPPGLTAAALRGNSIRLVHPDGGAYALLLRPGAGAEEMMSVALRLCRNEPVCRVMGWSLAASLPRGFPVPPESLKRLAFSFIRDASHQKEEVRFDCAATPRAVVSQCL